MKKLPKVSICIPVYNNPEGLKRTLRSIASQSYRDYEVLITDDSTDDSVREVVGLFNKTIPRLTYHRNKERAGSPGNWNRSLDMAKGKYIKIIHHDDWLKSRTSLVKMVSLADSVAGPVLVFASSLGISTQMQQISINRPEPSIIEAVANKPMMLLNGNIIGAPSATLFTNDSKLRFDEILIWLVDVDFYIATLNTGYTLKYINEELVCTTTGSSQQITSNVENSKEVEFFETAYLIDKWCPDIAKADYSQISILLDKYGVKTLRSLKGINFSPRQKLAIRRLLLLNNVDRVKRRFT